MITTKQALLIAAAAFIAQPFVSHAINNWDTYRSEADAWEACIDYADRVGSFSFHLTFPRVLRKSMDLEPKLDL